MKLYCVQSDIVWENKPANFAKIQTLLRAAAPARGSLVLLPEMFATGFSMNVSATQEGQERETTQFLKVSAIEFGVFLMGGLVPPTPTAKGRNQAVVFSPDGKELARYSKLQTFTLGGESDHYEAGSEIVLFDWRGFAIAPFICYDLRFPEHFRAATRRGAQIITVIANWPVVRIQHWVTLLQARAIENQAYVVGVNRTGTDPKLTYDGRSLIISPKGDVIAEAGSGECIISAEVSLADLETYRRDLPFLKDMRPA